MMNTLVRAQNLSYKINDKKLFQGISFELLKGKALHIQGENGSGKTTLLRMVCGLTKPTKGDLIIQTDKEVCFIGHKNAIKQYLNVEDNLILMNLNNHKDLQKYLSVFNLDKSLDINIANLSFGQQKKIALLRLFLNSSDLLILDEPTSALDITIQNQILDLLKSLQDKYSLSYIFISHDMNVIRSVSDKVLVLKSGKLVEYDIAESVFQNPKNEYTKNLIRSVI